MIYSVAKKDRSVKGEIHLEGSKSISNRVLIIEALMGEKIEKKNLAKANDTVVLAELLKSKDRVFDAHDAGTTFRFMTAYLAAKPGDWILTGSDRMKQRPIGDLVAPLRQLGAVIEYLEKENFPPVKISGGKLKGGEVQVHSGISSQFASALLMIAPCLEDGLTLELTGDLVSQPYLEMTLSLMNYFGVANQRKDNTIHVSHQSYKPRDIYIESDWSAASYYYEMAALSDEADITLSGLLQNSFQGDSAITFFMEKFGVRTIFGNKKITLTKTSLQHDLHFNLKDQPDLAPALFATCAGLSTPAHFEGIEHLQYKESHREKALQAELAKCGITVERSGDGIDIHGKFRKDHYSFSTYLDHRMAMALAPLAICCEQVFIEDPIVVKKSYPAFWQDLGTLGFEILEKQG